MLEGVPEEIPESIPEGVPEGFPGGMPQRVSKEPRKYIITGAVPEEDHEGVLEMIINESREEL